MRRCIGRVSKENFKQVWLEPIVLAVGLYKILRVGREGETQAEVWMVRLLLSFCHVGAPFPLYFCGILARGLQKAEPTDWQGRDVPLLL